MIVGAENLGTKLVPVVLTNGTCALPTSNEKNYFVFNTDWIITGWIVRAKPKWDFEAGNSLQPSMMQVVFKRPRSVWPQRFDPKSVLLAQHAREFRVEYLSVSVGKLFCQACKEEHSIKTSIPKYHIPGPQITNWRGGRGHFGQKVVCVMPVAFLNFIAKHWWTIVIYHQLLYEVFPTLYSLRISV